jgi:hypothetical protein
MLNGYHSRCALFLSTGGAVESTARPPPPSLVFVLFSQHKAHYPT